MGETVAGSRVVRQLLDRGMSKYSIAKQLGVTWQTVNNWYLGRYEPSQTYASKLQAMLK